MILKIATPGPNGNGTGWRFIDNVKEVSSYQIVLDDYNKSVESGSEYGYKDVFLTYHDLNYGTGLLKQVGNVRYDIIGMVAYMKDGSYNVYIADLAVYVMSDEGKTIERIN